MFIRIGDLLVHKDRVASVELIWHEEMEGKNMISIFYKKNIKEEADHFELYECEEEAQKEFERVCGLLEKKECE